MQIYYGQLYSNINYGSQLWGHNENTIEQTNTPQKKTQFDSFHLPTIKRRVIQKSRSAETNRHSEIEQYHIYS